jgi:hypothetical protein
LSGPCGDYQAVIMACKDPEMSKQGIAGKRQHATLLVPQKLGVIGGLKEVRA